MIVYIDTSVVVPLVKQELHSPAVAEYLDDLHADGHVLVAAHVLQTELARVARRSGASETTAAAVTERITIVDMTRADYRGAGAVGEPGLGTLDALHLQVALRIPADAMLTFDVKLAASAQACGLLVLDPLVPRTFVS